MFASDSTGESSDILYGSFTASSCDSLFFFDSVICVNFISIFIFKCNPTPLPDGAVVLRQDFSSWLQPVCLVLVKMTVPIHLKHDWATVQSVLSISVFYNLYLTVFPCHATLCAYHLDLDKQETAIHLCCKNSAWWVVCHAKNQSLFLLYHLWLVCIHLFSPNDDVCPTPTHSVFLILNWILNPNPFHRSLLLVGYVLLVIV